MKTTTYRCDRCQRYSTDKSELDLKEIKVGIREMNYASSSYHAGFHIYNPRKELTAEWCKTCCAEVGFVSEQGKDPNAAEEVRPSLEDLIREIVAEEVENF